MVVPVGCLSCVFARTIWFVEINNFILYVNVWARFGGTIHKIIEFSFMNVHFICVTSNQHNIHVPLHCDSLRFVWQNMNKIF